MYQTLVEAKVPFPHLMTYFVSGVEFVGRSLLIVGFLSSPACVALLADMLVAILTTKLPAMPQGIRLLTGSTISLPAGSPVRAHLYLADLLASGKVQCRLLARRSPE